VTACTLAFQIIITRLFSSVLAYHFSFLAISLAMLGTGAGALFLYLRPARFRGVAVERLLARWCAGFSLLLVAVPILLVRLDFRDANGLGLGFGLNLALACTLCALPPFASGVVVALAIDRYRRAIGAVYAYDLAGAGVGALLVVPVLWLAPAPDLLVALGVVSGLATALFAAVAPLERRVGLTVAGLGAGLFLLARFSPLLYLDPHYTLPPDALKHAERWTPLARVFGFELPRNRSLALLFYDRVYAPVPIVTGDRLPPWEEIATGPASVGYAFTGPGHTLVIGGGGGRDIYNALASGQMPVDVIELSEGNRRVVDEDLGHLSGRPYSRPGVRTRIGDGRSLLAARDTRYDQIHIGFTDTLSPNAAHGFALTENNLYTVEAFQEYLDHLKPRGILNVSRLLKLVGDEALRVTVLTLEALRQRGIEDPLRHVVVVLGKDLLGPPTGTVLARLEPYSSEELARLGDLVAERAEGFLLVPGGPMQGEWKALAEAESLEAFCNAHRLDVCPPTDDKPFFFSMQRLGQLGDRLPSGYFYSTDPYTILMLTLGILLVLSGVAFVLPLRAVPAAEGPRASSLLFFAAIGLGFMLLEIVLIQRFVLFLGFPTYALSVVLFALLIFSGLGSLLSSRFAAPRGPLAAALGGVATAIAVSAFALQPLLRALIELPFAARVVVAVALLAPFGLALGMAMPMGLRRFSALHPGGVPYAWGVNGVASVLASVLGMAVAIQFGFTVATLAASACYFFAVGHVLVGRWADQGGPSRLRP
jgi:hypothetical protein